MAVAARPGRARSSTPCTGPRRPAHRTSQPRARRAPCTAPDAAVRTPRTAPAAWAIETLSRRGFCIRGVVPSWQAVVSGFVSCLRVLGNVCRWATWPTARVAIRDVAGRVRSNALPRRQSNRPFAARSGPDALEVGIARDAEAVEGAELGPGFLEVLQRAIGVAAQRQRDRCVVLRRSGRPRRARRGPRSCGWRASGGARRRPAGPGAGTRRPASGAAR